MIVICDMNNNNVIMKTCIFFFRLQFDCKHEIQLPMVDPDGDTLKCRWAVGKECDSICNGVPVAKLDEVNKKHSYQGYKSITVE